MSKEYGIESMKPKTIETDKLLAFIKKNLNDIQEAKVSIENRQYSPCEATQATVDLMQFKHLEGMADMLKTLAIDVSLGKIK